ncbi:MULTISPECIES: A24 family peptidase [Halostella]|uniref:A24 family peptidase n=1 Tax=Halostella TaxID=1843185 RepID=UPI001F18101A|nr:MULTISPECIES: A24 family peptidase [Halostella]
MLEAVTVLVEETSTVDLLRLLAVPVFAWAAYRDVATRRVPNAAWAPLTALALALLAQDAWTAWTASEFAWRRFLVPTAVSIGLVVPLAYLFWRTGGFGGADAKALMVIALLFPAYPVYFLPNAALPLQPTNVGVFSFTVLTNTVLFGLAAPLLLAARNAVAGRFSSLMFVGRPVHVEAVPETHGRLLEGADGSTRGGLDLDALRMYLRWRGVDLETLRANADALRDPATLPDEPNPPTDGAVTAESPGAPAVVEDVDGRRSSDGGSPPGRESADDDPAAPTFDDPWGADAFLTDVDGAYGASASDLREGLDRLTTERDVWVSPGIPFLVPMFVGLVVALTYGDVLFGLLGLLGAV